MDDFGKFIIFLIVIFLFGMLLTLFLNYIYERQDVNQHDLFTKIEQCEAELPRNQHCTIIAVPEDITNDTN